MQETCTNCGAELAEGAECCPQCGQAAEPEQVFSWSYTTAQGRSTAVHTTTVRVGCSQVWIQKGFGGAVGGYHRDMPEESIPLADIERVDVGSKVSIPYVVILGLCWVLALGGWISGALETAVALIFLAAAAFVTFHYRNQLHCYCLTIFTRGQKPTVLRGKEQPVLEQTAAAIRAVQAAKQGH